MSVGTTVLTASFGADAPRRRGAAIQPAEVNPRYWQYNGRPVVLLGGSEEDNLFQLPELEDHLTLLASVGGNYVRNTMSARDPGNAQAFARRPDGRYDLERWNDEYWRRFESLLRLAKARDIIVQVEVWDRFDFSREPWENQPFNPQNNVNYTYAESGLRAHYPDHPLTNKQPFFYATPRQRNNHVVFRYQQRFVDKLLDISLRYPNVLYCIDNETSGDRAWGAYWADHIHRLAREAGVRAFVTEMWDDWNLKATQHRWTLDHPEHYDFIDVSQNNHQRGENQWSNLQWVRAHIADHPCPVNAVKTYGADKPDHDNRLLTMWYWWRRLTSDPPAVDTAGDYGSTDEGTARWWRHLIGGGAAVRFHRPPAGVGLTDDAQRHLRSAQLFLMEFDIVRAVPDADHALLTERDPNEAYATHIGDEAYAIYFPGRGEVRLTTSPRSTYLLRWLDISAGRWRDDSTVHAEDHMRLTSPGGGQWLAVLRRRGPADR
jgi:hypothetical protein